MGPKVFEEGVVTLAVGPDGAAMYVGAHRVAMFRSVRAEVEDGAARVEVGFDRSHDPEVGLRIEENVRLVQSVPWISVRR